MPSSGKSRVICPTADNADFHLFNHCTSVVPVGDIQLGFEDMLLETEHFNKHYMSSLGKVSDINVEQLLATKDDDKFAQDVIDNQNDVAILRMPIAPGYLLGHHPKHQVNCQSTKYQL